MSARRHIRLPRRERSASGRMIAPNPGIAITASIDFVMADPCAGPVDR